MSDDEMLATLKSARSCLKCDLPIAALNHIRKAIKALESKGQKTHQEHE